MTSMVSYVLVAAAKGIILKVAVSFPLPLAKLNLGITLARTNTGMSAV